MFKGKSSDFQYWNLSGRSVGDVAKFRTETELGFNI